jgi:hypothetical protein
MLFCSFFWKNAQCILVAGCFLMTLMACRGEHMKTPRPQIPNSSERFEQFFGRSLRHKLKVLHQDLEGATDAKALAEVFRVFLTLRDSLQLQCDFEQARRQTSLPPDLFWVKDVVPGLVPEWLEKPPRYAFFINYTYWLAKAQATSGKEDEAYFALCIDLYPSDSVEYLHPNYVLQTEPTQVYSLLGRGYHLEHLRKLDSLYRTDYPFFAPLLSLKQRCVADISNPKTQFWEDSALIRQELQEILAADLGVLSKADIIAIRKVLEPLNP